MSRILRHPRFWLAGFILWFSVLWMLSSNSAPGNLSPPFPHFDKVAHFGYYFGGGGLLAAYLFRLAPDVPNWKTLISIAILVIAAIGAMDEWHQSFTPGRSGNDLYDWLADLMGAMAGAFTFKRLHHPLK